MWFVLIDIYLEPMELKDDHSVNSQIERLPSRESSKNIIHFVQDWILLNAKANSPEDWRDSLKLIVAAALAFCLWFLLGRIAILHIEASREFARKIADLPAKDTDRVDQIEKAALGFEGTVKTLYALVTPLATAVTGYFFSASALSSKERKASRSQTELLVEENQEKASN